MIAASTFRGQSSAQNKRMSRSEYAAVAGAATSQFIESFNEPDDPYLRAGLRFAPLLLLSPQRKGTGFEGFIKDPRVIGAMAVAAIIFAGQKDRFTGPKTITIVRPPKLTVNGDDRFLAEVEDRSGRVITDSVSWESSNNDIAEIDAEGKVHGKAAGSVFITAKFDGFSRTVRLEVK